MQSDAIDDKIITILENKKRIILIQFRFDLISHSEYFSVQFQVHNHK